MAMQTMKLIPRSADEVERLKRELADLTREYMNIEAEKKATNDDLNDRLKVTWASMEKLKAAIEDQ